MLKILISILVFIQFSFSNQNEKFEFNPLLDPLLMGTGLALQLTSNYKLGQLSTYRNSPETMYSWDKPWVGQKQDWAVNWSNYLTYPAIALGLGYSATEGFHNNKMSYFYQDITLLTEILTFNSAINLWVRSLGIWPRPRYFNSDGPEKTSGEILGSFYSGHASSAFAVASYYSLALTNRYGFEKTWWISSLSLLSAGTISWLRVVGGKHYPSDVIVGAMVGSVIASAFYFWRAKDNRRGSENTEGISMMASPNFIQFAFTF